MANANKWYSICPVQAADAAIPTGHHIAPVIVPVNPGERTRITWVDVAAPGENPPHDPLNDDIVGTTIAILSGSVRHAPHGDPEAEVQLTGVDGSEGVVVGPSNITLTSGWGEEFECVGSEPALLQIYAYVPEWCGIIEGEDPDAE